MILYSNIRNKDVITKYLYEKISMIDVIPITWYIESPIDFEHKKYLLLAYLIKVDQSFLLNHLSPHLLHMESLVRELNNFRESYQDIRKKFDKERYVILADNSKLIGEDNQLVYEIKEIVDFSIPQLKFRITNGNKILKKYKQILY